MYQPMLFLHWKQIKVALIPFVIAAFGLPLVAVQGLGGSIEMTTAAAEAYRSVAAYGIWMPAYPLLAGGIGITLALSAWNWDHQLNHVYALSLPISRWRYAALKMGDKAPDLHRLPLTRLGADPIDQLDQQAIVREEAIRPGALEGKLRGNHRPALALGAHHHVVRRKIVMKEYFVELVIAGKVVNRPCRYARLGEIDDELG